MRHRVSTLSIILACLIILKTPTGVRAQVVYSLDDFDDANAQNDFFGPSGKWEDGGTRISVQFPAPGFDDMGRCLRLDWRLVPASVGGGWWIQPGPRGVRDLREFKTLRLRVRGEGFGQRETLCLKLADGERERELPLSTPTGAWQQVEINLDQFAGVDHSRVRELTIVLAPPATGDPIEGRLWVDEIQLVAPDQPPGNDEALLDLLEKRTFDYFVQTAHPETGLVLDAASFPDRCSIAAVGYALSALPIGVERGWIARSKAEALAERILHTLDRKAAYHGFYYHFISAATAERMGECEVSSIDTALLVAGALCAREYFGEKSKVGRLADRLYRAVEWPAMLDDKTGLFHMAWWPGRPLSEAKWNYYTDEAVLICLLAIGSPTHPVGKDVFRKWKRETGSYKEQTDIVKSWFGSLFTYFVAGLWVDLRGLTEARDPAINWWENSRKAALANRQFCLDHAKQYETYRVGWGLTACLGPRGYGGNYGALPCGARVANHDGTIAPCAAAMSLPVFKDSRTPNHALEALRSYWDTKLWGIYGYRDGFNLGPAGSGPQDDWYAHNYLGLNQGFTILGIENYRTGLIWRLMEQCEYLRKAVEQVYEPIR